MFRTIPLAIIRSFSLYAQQWYMSYRFADSLRTGSGRSSVSKPVWHMPLLCVKWKTRDDGQSNCPKHVEFCPDSIRKLSANLYGCTVAVRTVKNSWWWTEELSETCRILFQK